MRPPLSNTELKLMEFIRVYKNMNGTTPRAKAIMEEFDMTKGLVNKHLYQIEAKGYIKRDGNIHILPVD